MERCERFIDMISAQLDGELSPEQERELFDHVLVCEDCRGLQLDLLELNEAMGEMRVQPSEGLAEQISAAVQAEKASNVIPFYKKKNFLGSMITAAAMIALIAVSGTNLSALLDSEAQSRMAQQPAAADIAGAATPRDETTPETELVLEGAEGDEGSLAKAAETKRLGDSDVQMDAPPAIGTAPIASPEPPIASPAPPPAVSAQVPAQNPPSGDETTSTHAAGDAPVGAPPAGAPPAGNPLADSSPPLEAGGAGQNEGAGVAGTRAAALPIPADEGEVPAADGADAGGAPLSLMMAPAATYVGEITFRTFSPLPDFLAELGVPEADEGFSDYQLILSAAEYRALETQFLAHELSYEAVTEGEGFAPEGEFGIIIILYAD